MTFAPTALAFVLIIASFLTPSSVASSRIKGAGSSVSIAYNESRAYYLAAFEQYVLTSYTGAQLITYGLSPVVYREALLGYYSLQQRGLATTDQQVVTIIDFALPSSQKRLWVVDLRAQKVLFHTLVAHGKNSGEDQARTFSNVEGSEMSSLGFYVTGQTYRGKHGLTLKLHGQDANYNTNAARRAVVVHSANYVSEAFVRQHGRLGRSQGCPALPPAQSPQIIRVIKNGTVLYAHGPSSVLFTSAWLELDPALNAFAQSHGLVRG
jgi:hypothetical protein